MNYRHIYHAGHYSDVVKHLVLLVLLQKLLEKDKPLRVIDTHGGIGLYDLQATAALKTQEFLGGIGKISAFSQDLPTSLRAYWNIIKDVPGNEDTLRFYPGSPYFIAKMLRAGDTLQVSELHPEDLETLRQNLTTLRKARAVQVFHQDGYQSLKAFLPPKERRGLILIDPPFEVTNEWELIIENLQEALRRFATGVYCIWYPLKDPQRVRSFYEGVRQLGHENLIIEYLDAQPNKAEGLKGCGLCIINPPWQTQERLECTLADLKQLIDSSKKSQVNFFHLF